jgi:hypothetical protein
MIRLKDLADDEDAQVILMSKASGGSKLALAQYKARTFTTFTI